MSNVILDGIIGLAIGDALGVPVEFENRETLKRSPVVGMRSCGTYDQPKGTWSDDTSMTLGLVDSLANGLDYDDMMKRFSDWINYGDYTATGEVFDIGIATRKALMRFQQGIAPLDCGGKSELDNGNGSLMRILPILFYIEDQYSLEFQENPEAFDVIHNVSKLTHSHERSQIACGIYISVASKLLGSVDINASVRLGIDQAIAFYENQAEFSEELEHFSRFRHKEFKHIDVEKIKSSGYVVDTLEAAIWCLLNTNDYQSCVLKAVNLGEDTDTVAAVAGGLAGLTYGYKSMPGEWIETLARRVYIEDLCNCLLENLNTSCGAN